MSSRETYIEVFFDMINGIQFLGMSHINFSTSHYDAVCVDMDNMIKACDAQYALKPNPTVCFTENKEFIRQPTIVQVFKAFSSRRHY